MSFPLTVWIFFPQLIAVFPKLLTVFPFTFWSFHFGCLKFCLIFLSFSFDCLVFFLILIERSFFSTVTPLIQLFGDSPSTVGFLSRLCTALPSTVWSVASTIQSFFLFGDFPWLFWVCRAERYWPITFPHEHYTSSIYPNGAKYLPIFLILSMSIYYLCHFAFSRFPSVQIWISHSP